MHLTVSSLGFAAAIEPLQRKKRMPLGFISFQGRTARIECGTMVSHVEAAGDWSGRVIFESDVLLALAKAPLLNKPELAIDFDGRRLTLGTLTIRASCERAPFDGGCSGPAGVSRRCRRTADLF